MAVAACPGPETLTAFARGELVGAQLSAVADHVGACGACCRALRLVPDDGLASLARAAAVSPPTVHSGGVPLTLMPAAKTATDVPAALLHHPRYRIVGQLGAGGMGVVYKAEHRMMGRVVALKVVAPNLTARAGAVERFQKEVRAAARLNHPNIVQAHDADEAGGMHFLVMEYVEGVSLDRLVAKKGPLPVPTACAFVRQAALGLQHAAQKGMVHRDIKPHNLMVTRKGQLKILDFGIARFVAADEPAAAPNGRPPVGAAGGADAGATNPNLLMGTPDYLSPEQAKNSHDVDPRSDIYSLGCTLYFLLTGRPPFGGTTALIDKLLAHAGAAPPPVEAVRPEVPAGLAAVLARMTAKAPADRYQKAAEVAAALYPFTRAADAEPAFEIVDAVATTPAPRTTLGTPRTTFGAGTHPESDTAPQPDLPTLAEVVRPRKKRKKPAGWWKRRKWTVLGGAALALAAAGVLLAGARKPTDKSARPADPAPGAAAKADPPQAPPKAKDDKGTKTPQVTVIAPPKDPPVVLYVLPSTGVRFGDYDRVRERLKEKGVGVETASTDGGRSWPFEKLKGEPLPPGKPGAAVPIDKVLTPATKLSDYAAVAFAGHSVEEYVFDGRGCAAAGRAIDQMRAARRPVAGIGMGIAVLAYHKALRGKRAAWCDPLEREYPSLLTAEYARWQDRGWESDDKVITATGGREAGAFADAISAAIKNGP